MKKIISVIFFILITTSVFCEEWEFIVTEEAPVFWSSSSRNGEFLRQGMKIFSDDNYGVRLLTSWMIQKDDVGFTLRREATEDMAFFGFVHGSELPNRERKRVVNARYVAPVNSIELFDRDILSDYNNILTLYTVEILRSMDRETLFVHEQYYKENQVYWDDAEFRDIYWYELYDSARSEFFVFNSVLGFGGRWELLVNNIEKTDYGYKVKCKNSTSNYSRISNQVPVIPTLDWTLTLNKQYFNLLIFIDGDFVNLYIDSFSNLLGTFVSVSDEFIRQYNNLIKTNTCDLTNIQWPKRAEGSTGAPPVFEITDIDKTSDYIDSHESAMAQDNGEKSSLPLPLLFAIIGGVAVIVGVVVVVLRKNK